MSARDTIAKLTGAQKKLFQEWAHEARAGGVATDDAAKVAGHASTKTTSAVYDRATLEAAERFAEARTRRRASGK